MEISWQIVLIMIQVLIAIVLYFAFPISGTEETILSLTHGDVRGHIKYSPLRNRPYARYLGVPYALPPVGERRFARPKPFTNPWEGIRDGTRSSPVCIQPDFYHDKPNETFGVEDCLALNIYQPTSCTEENRCPVIIWLHGGNYALLDGSPKSFDAMNFMDYDIIFVGVNYRLGVLGFLTLENDEAPGNLGLRDQALAIKMVKKEIHNLHGHPNQITLAGHEAGAHATFIHLVSPHHEKGSFTRIISQSGSSIEDPMIRLSKPRKDYAYQLASSLGCNREILKCLKNRPANYLQNKVSIFSEMKQFNLPNPWVPVVDGDFASDPFLPDYPEKIIEAGNMSHRIPVLLGTVSEEGILLMKEFFQHPETFARFTESLPLIMFNREKGAVTSDIKNIINLVKRFYIPGGELSYLQNKQIIAMFSDIIFTSKIGRTTKLLEEYSPIYQYLYKFSGTHSFGDLAFYSPLKLGLKLWLQTKGIGLNMRNGFGSCNGDELFGLFRMGFLQPPMSLSPTSDLDKKVSVNMLTMWTDFARTGNPTPTGSFLEDNSKWLSIQESNGMVMEIQSKRKMINDLFIWKRVEFYHKVFQKIFEQKESAKDIPTVAESSTPHEKTDL